MTRLLTPDQMFELAAALASNDNEINAIADKIRDWVDTTYDQSAAVDALPFEVADYMRVTNTMTVDEAVLYCKFLDLGNHTDWRLPTYDEIDQLHQIFDNGTDSDEYSELHFWLQEDVGKSSITGGVSHILPVRTKEVQQ